jgi:hypothetical protein
MNKLLDWDWYLVLDWDGDLDWDWNANDDGDRYIRSGFNLGLDGGNEKRQTVVEGENRVGRGWYSRGVEVLDVLYRQTNSIINQAAVEDSCHLGRII